MPKKQLKVPTEKIDQYIGKTVHLNFVLSNGSVVLGQPVSLESASVKVKNTRGHVLHLPLSQIEEIWAEEKVS